MKQAPLTYDEDEIERIGDQSDNELLTPAQQLKTGEYLMACHLITEDQLQIALQEQKKSKGMIGSILVALDFISDETLADVLAHKAALPRVRFHDTQIDHSLLRELGHPTALRHHIVPFMRTNSALHVALADPFDILARDECRQSFPNDHDLRYFVASKSDIIEHLSAQGDANSFYESLAQSLFEEEKPTSREHPVIELVNHILADAVSKRASDIHLEPEETFVRIRYRIDGALRQVRALHLMHWSALANRIKILAGLNIADTRSIQDGRFQKEMNGRTIDFRLGIMPCIWGETFVLRILDHKRSLLPLDSLGYSPACKKALLKLTHRPHGLILMTGPTGSGKTTTLYSLLQKINREDVHIATFEDPVEFQLDQIRQTAVQEEHGLGFAEGVRGVLRMDPDIILIGEIRDADTAQMALRAAMTGHQVYSTLHCNDVFSALPRLYDLGLSPSMLAGNIIGIVAQRLVRTLCPTCKGVVHDEASQSFCPTCNGTGKHGRTSIAEVLRITPEIDELVSKGASRHDLVIESLKSGFQSMQEDGLKKVESGLICYDDLCRAVDMTAYDTHADDAP